MSTGIKLIIAVGAMALVAALVYLSFQHDQVRYEVCMDFQGRQRCAIASGQTREEAIRAAQTAACTLITSGRDENILCLDSPPRSVRELPSK